VRALIMMAVTPRDECLRRTLIDQLAAWVAQRGWSTLQRLRLPGFEGTSMARAPWRQYETQNETQIFNNFRRAYSARKFHLTKKLRDDTARQRGKLMFVARGNIAEYCHGRAVASLTIRGPFVARAWVVALE
jgi:hypothetical protein